MSNNQVSINSEFADLGSYKAAVETLTAPIEVVAEIGSQPQLLSSACDKALFLTDLFAAQSTALIKFLIVRYRNPEDARDIAQEAWLRMFRLKAPESLDNAKAFLFQTASNLAIDRLRRNKLEQRYLESESAIVEHDLAPSAERTLVSREQLERIEAGLRKLPLKCRQAFVLHRSRGLSYPEIAAQLGVSTSMVEKHIIQALRQLRAELAD